MLPTMASVRLVCKNFPQVAADKPLLQLIESFLDISAHCTIEDACRKSPILAKRVLSRLNRGQIVAELCEAVGTGDIKVVRILCAAAGELLDKSTGELLIERDAAGNSALSKAVWRKSLPMLEFILASGAPLNARNGRGQTVLHQAAEQGNLEVVEWLVGNGLQVDDADGDGFTALLKAAQYGRRNVVEWILTNEVHVDTRNQSGQSALHVAAGALREDSELIKLLLSHGLKVSDTDKWGHTALHYAAVAKHFEIIELFLKQCFHDEKPRMNDLMTVLFAASNADYVEFVEYLTDTFGVDVAHVSEKGRTALHEAAAGDSVETATLLVDKGCRLDKADNLGITPIIEASRFGCSRVLSYLLSINWNTDEVDFAGRTALHHAAVGGHMNVINTLLYSAEINCCDFLGWTPLHCAAASGQLRVVQMLIQTGATLNNETISGKTPLVLAIERGHSEVARRLVENLRKSIPETAPEPLNTSSKELDIYEEYRLDRSDIHFDAPLLQESAIGFWLDSPIEIKVKKDWQSKNVVEELDQWSKLSHPHIVKLYGICYGDGVEDPFFVYERPIYGSLFEYLANEENRDRVWDKLYEAAMGLEYLHDRGVVHGDISCSSIAVAANGFAKLKNLGSKNDETNFRQNPSWTSPEELAGLPTNCASDVYTLGLTIVQAFKSGGDVWNIFGGIRDAAILSGQLPMKPPAMNLQQWKLAQRMCCLKPVDRLLASDVVRELQRFVYKDKHLERHSYELDEGEMPLSWSSLGEVPMIKMAQATFDEALRTLDRMTSDAIAMNAINRDVYGRLKDTFELLTSRVDSPPRDLVQLYADILHNFISRLEHTQFVGFVRAARFAVARREAENAFSIHGDIDVLMAVAELPRTVNHEWRTVWESRHCEQMHAIMTELSDVTLLVQDIDDELGREEALTYLRFELTKHPTSYFVVKNPSDVTRTKAVISSLVTSRNANWFIPPYEVKFDSLDQFSSGAFGSVHHGNWKSSQVVVKKLKVQSRKKDSYSHSSWTFESEASASNSLDMFRLEDVQAAFLNEVEIWYKLYHPNVVQLFGACHVGEPFFVCEFAGKGQLDKYLKSHQNEVFDKLYEAALGLRYLHQIRIIHGDLKCNNILIGNDGRAKLTDFGLSAQATKFPDEVEDPETEVEGNSSPNVGAIRWKAPEVLIGEKPTFASDIYSFGMCILEAVSGSYPWGNGMLDIAVKYKVVKEKRIPQRPTKCEEEVYVLVQRMCQFEASARIDVNEVVSGLRELR